MTISKPLSPGETVRVTNRFLQRSAVADMLAGKIGTVVGDDGPESDFEVVVHFEGTSRTGGMFAFFEMDLERT